MKKFIVMLILFLEFYPNVLYSQGTLKPVIVSPFIGEKLDRIEEDYFNVFTTITDLQEANFYVDQDSSLSVNIKYFLNNTLIDTNYTYKYKFTLSTLRDKINQRLVKDIKESKVNELEFNTDNNKSFEGTIYSYDNEQIRIIKNGFTTLRGYQEQEDYISILKYPEIESMKMYKTSTEFVWISTLAMGIIGVSVGSSLGPEVLSKPEGMLDFREIEGALLGGLIGTFVGFAIGMITKFPEEYNMNDADAKRIIKENSLLPNGL